MAGVLQRHIPQLHGIVLGDHQGLGGVNVAVVALIAGVGHTVDAAVLGLIQGLAHRLPGNAPVVAGLAVAHIDIVAGPVHGHTVAPETGDAVILRGLVERVAAGGVVEHAAHILHAQIVGPGCGQIHTVNDILSFLIIKISVLHNLSSKIANTYHDKQIYYKHFPPAGKG